MRRSSRGIDRIALTFDEPNLVANAGLVLVATLAKRLGLEALVDEQVRIPSKSGGFSPGRKVLTLVHAMVAGATHIDHADVLRAGKSADVLEHRVMAPSTLGTFLRAFTFGHVRQLEAVIAEALRRAWSQMSLPARLVVDVDSTIVEVAGKLKRARPTATRESSATTHCSRRGPTPERSSTPGCARARPTPNAARSASVRS